jgi:hypothetical protein
MFTCQKKKTRGCRGCIKGSPGKTRILKEVEHFRIEQIAAKTRLQNELKPALKDPRNVYKTVATLFKEYQKNLVSEDDLTYNHVVAVVKHFTQDERGFHQLLALKVTQTLDDLDIPVEFSKTNDKQQFFQYDNKCKNNRIVIFFSNLSLKYLGESQQWFMDAAFKSAPKGFMQLLVIHGTYNNQTFPCAFALSQHRTEYDYKEIFSILKERANEKNILLNPQTVLADFEHASTKAIKFHFTNVQVNGKFILF